MSGMIILAEPIRSCLHITNRRRQFVARTFFSNFHLKMVVLLLTVLFGMSAAAIADDNPQQPSVVQRSEAATAKEQIPMPKLAATVKKPTTWTEILQNLKFSLDRRLLDRTDFYTDDNLKHLFGATRVVRSEEHPNYYDVCDLIATVGSVPRACIRVFPWKYGAELSSPAEYGQRYQLTAEIVQSVFGLPTDLPTTNPTSGMDGNPTIPPLPAPTHPLKNSESANIDLHYVFGVPPNFSEASFYTNAQGEIVHFDISTSMNQ